MKTSSLDPKTINELAQVNQKIVAKNKEVILHEGLIEIKRERNARELALRPLLLNVGMAFSILFAIVAINWRTSAEGDLVDLGEVEADMNEIIEIPVSQQEPPPPPQQEVFQIVEVKDTEIIEEINIALDVEITENESVEVIEITAEVEEEKVDEIFVIVEQEPLPKGGFDSFYAYLAEELNYPARALRFGLEGTVFIQFVIEKDGSITQAQVVKGIGMGCDEEALRVIESAPAWEPGKQRGKAVRVKKVIPVRFKMAKD